MPPRPRPLPVPSAPAPMLPPPGFAEKLEALSVELAPAALEHLGAYLAQLLAMNAHMNLTAITDPGEAWERHILDALSLVPLLAGVGPKGRLVDVGSGGGLPGVPLAIARPELEVTLVEATQKKAAFLKSVASALGLSNVRVRAERAEGLAARIGGPGFDAVTARAVARLEKLIPLCAPLVRAGGLLLLVKGQRADEELVEAGAALEATSVTHVRTVPTPTGKIVVLRRGPAAPASRA